MAKEIVFDNTESSRIINAILDCPQTIEAISLLNIDEDISLILRYLASFQKNLKTLKIHKAFISGNPKIFSRLLKRIFEQCPNIEHVSLTSLKYHPQDIIEIFPQAEHITSLTIGDNPLLSSADLLTIVLNCHHLNSIHLYKMDNLSDQDIEFMLGNRLSDKLKYFTLNGIKGLDSAAYNSILKCSKLQMLHIIETDRLATETLIKIPEYLTELKSLKLEKVCGIKSSDYGRFFMKNGMKLNTFVFTDCCTNFNDKGLKSMVLSLHNTLTTLTLQNCLRLTNIDSLAKCKLLRKLDLTGCKLITRKEIADLQFKLKNLIV